MVRYFDYISVDQEYLPIFSMEQDTRHPDKWMQFIPHSSLRRVLNALVPALERASATAKKPVWVSGTYGTGKTYAAFLIKHLLEDDPVRVEEYFLGYKDNPFTMGFDSRVLALRKQGSYLVAFCSGASGVRNSRLLLMEVQRAISDELRKRGLRWQTQTVSESIRARITDPQSTFNWPQAFEKYRDRFEANSAEDVVANVAGGTSVAVLDNVAEVLDAEGFSTFSSPDQVKNWIEEVISINKLPGIVLIWDEMTNFFSREAPIDTLQELAHSTARMPFYLYLITHRSPEQLELPDETMRVLSDRFHQVTFEMERQTAYELMQSAFKPIPATHHAWERQQDRLWDKVRGVISFLRNQDKELEERDAKNLLPIHPYSAYLLAIISRYMSSSQRTLFQFMQTDVPGSFVEFCSNNSPDSPDGQLLTADCLWDYFFKEKTGDLPSKAHQAIDYYTNVEEHLDTQDDRRIAKTVLLLYAFQHLLSGVRLIRPTKDNLIFAFYGTPLRDRISDVMQTLCSLKVFHRVGIADAEEYTITLVGIDEEELESQLADVRRTCPINYLVGKNQTLGKELTGLFTVQAESRRQDLVILTAGDLIKTGERVFQRNSELAPFMMRTAIVVAHNEDERRVCLEQVRTLTTDRKFDRVVFVVLGNVFTEGNLSDWQEEYARSLYARARGDSSLAKHHMTRADDTVKAWIRSVFSYRHFSCFRGRIKEISSAQAFPRLLHEIVSEVYPYRPETLHNVATAYRASSGKRGAEIGIGLTGDARGEYAGIVETLKRIGVWDSPAGFFEANQEHALSRMKAVMDEFFSKDGAFKVSTLWDTLQHPPFGLYESSMAMVLMGLLVRQFAMGYYKSDGVTSTSLGQVDLVDMVESAVKKRNNASKLEIRRMSRVDERLCSVTARLLGCDPENVQYPKLAQQKLRLMLTDLGYPIWCLTYIKDADGCTSEFRELVGLFRALDSFVQYAGEVTEPEYQELAHDIAMRDDYVPSARRLMTRQHMAEGFLRFVQSSEPTIDPLLSELGMTADDIRPMIASLKNEDPWLWDEKSILERLPNISAQLRLIRAIALLNGDARKSLDASLASFHDLFLRRNLPDALLLEPAESAIKGTLKSLVEIARATGADHLSADEYDALATAISQHSMELRSHLMDSTGSIMRFARTHVGQELTPDEACAVDAKLRQLPREASPEVIRTLISSEMESVLRNQLIKILSHTWCELTRSTSPSEWSSLNGVPIQWVLGDSELLWTLDTIDNPMNRPVDEIRKANRILNECASDLRRALDPDRIRESFYAKAVEPYFDFPRVMPSIDELSTFLRDTVSSDVHSWPSRPDSVRDSVKAWLEHNYLRELHSMRQQILQLDESAVRSVLEELISDTAVGLKALSILAAKKAATP